MSIAKKITFLISSLSGGGAEAVCVNIANSFSKNGWIVDLLVLNLNNEIYLNQISKKINIINLNVDNTRYAFLPLFKYIFKNKKKLFLVFNHELATLLVLIKLISRIDIKIISRNISILSNKINEFKSGGVWKKFVVRLLTMYFYNKVDHVINQCLSMQNDLISIYPQLINRSSIIYNPLSSEIQNFIDKNNLLNIKKKDYILCVGRLENVKRFDYALKVFAGISTQFPNLRLKIVGQGSLEFFLKKKANFYGIENKVDFEGFKKNIIPYYVNAKVTLLTSLYEGYPNVLIESIALNTPVIAFNCPGGTKEIIQNGVNGFLIDNTDIIDYKQKLKIILTEKNKRNLKETINKNHIDNVFKSYEKVISSFL